MPGSFHGLTPYKSVPVGLGLYLDSVDILHIECDETTFGQQQHDLREDVVYLVFHTIVEAVNGHEVGAFLHSHQI